MKNIIMSVYFILFAFCLGLFHPESNILKKQLCNTVNTNQFNQTRSVGDLDLTTNPNPPIYTAQYNKAGAGGDIIPGTGVKLVDLGASDFVGVLPIVDVRTGDADAIEGILIYDPAKATKSIGDRVSIAGKGAIIVMEASAAIARGAKVALVLAAPGEVVTLGGEALLGKAMDKAAADGDLLRVQVLAEGVV